MVKDCVLVAITVIPNLYIIWQNHKKNRLSPKQRLRRNRAAQARLKLDEQEILKEAIHEEELKKMETGLENEENQDLLTSLHKKGQSLLKDKLNQVNKVVDDKLKKAQQTVNEKLKTGLSDKDDKKE